jgi:hypothetical protein
MDSAVKYFCGACARSSLDHAPNQPQNGAVLPKPWRFGGFQVKNNFLREWNRKCRSVCTRPDPRRCTPMIRKFLLSASLAALLILGISTQAHTALQQSQSGQQADQSKQVNGKVTAIGSDKKSFSLDVNDGNNKRTMQFVLDEKTQVQGRVGVGTDATVQYQPTNDGKNVALNIAPLSPPQ